MSVPLFPRILQYKELSSVARPGLIASIMHAAARHKRDRMTTREVPTVRDNRAGIRANAARATAAAEALLAKRSRMS